MDTFLMILSVLVIVIAFVVMDHYMTRFEKWCADRKHKRKMEELRTRDLVWRSPPKIFQSTQSPLQQPYPYSVQA